MIQDTIETYYPMPNLSVLPFEINDQISANQFSKISSEAGDFICKSIKSDNTTELEKIFKTLSSFKPKDYQLALPIRNKDGKFISQGQDQAFIMMSYIEHKNLKKKKPSIKNLFEKIKAFHTQTEVFEFPKKPQKNYTAYLFDGLDKIKTMFPDHPFCPFYELFLNTTLPKLIFTMGPIHADLNPHNIWMTLDDTICFSDFEDMQFGPHIKDYLEAASEYIFEPKILQTISPYLLSVAPNCTLTEIKYLLVRPRLDELVNLDKETASAHLDKLTLFLLKSQI